MATTFLELSTELLDWANRPIDETGMLTRAKSCINSAVLWANRSHSFKYAEKCMRVTYPANAFMIDLASLASNRVIGLNTIQVVSTGAFVGYPINIIEYENLQSKRRQSFKSAPLDSFSTTVIDRTASAIAITDGACGFTLGTSLGLFPTPVQNVELLITYNSLVDTLVNDADTNFFLDFGRDFILSKALQKFNTYMKADKRVEVNAEQLANEWESFKNWNNSVVNSHAISQ